jgi:hypothetical protein
LRIPNADRGVIESAKVHGYLLSRSHPVGRFKAAFFLALGYSADGWRQLQADLRSQHLSQDAVLEERTQYGQKYAIRATGRALGTLGGRDQRLDRAHGRGLPAVRHRVSGGSEMTFQLLDTIVLDRDLPDHGLCRGDLGAVVEVYEPDGLEVEFVTASGRKAALLTLSVDDVRPVADDDLVSVRPCRRSA